MNLKKEKLISKNLWINLSDRHLKLDQFNYNQKYNKSIKENKELKFLLKRVEHLNQEVLKNFFKNLEPN